MILQHIYVFCPFLTWTLAPPHPHLSTWPLTSATLHEKFFLNISVIYTWKQLILFIVVWMILVVLERTTAIMWNVSPCFQTVQSLVHVALVKFDHVRVHLFVVIANVSFGAAVGHGPKTKRRREIVGSLKLKLSTEKHHISSKQVWFHFPFCVFLESHHSI